MPEASLQALVHACLNDVAAAHPLSPHQRQVCHHIAQCRTAALGGFALDCDACGGARFSTMPAVIATARAASAMPLRGGLERTSTGGAAAGDLPNVP